MYTDSPAVKIGVELICTYTYIYLPFLIPGVLCNLVLNQVALEQEGVLGAV